MTQDARSVAGFSLSRATFFLALLAFGIPALGLLGHLLRLPLLYSMHPGFQAMSFVTASGLSAIALGYLSAWFERRTATVSCMALGAAAGAAMIISHVICGQDAIDPMIAGPLGFAPAEMGRTSVSTAVSMILLGLPLSQAVRRHAKLLDAFAGIAFLIALLALAGYAYSSAGLYACRSSGRWH